MAQWFNNFNKISFWQIYARTHTCTHTYTHIHTQSLSLKQIFICVDSTYTHTHTHKQRHPPAHIYSKNTGAILIASVNTFFNHIKTLSNNYHIHPRLVLVVSNTFLCDCVKLTEHCLSREFKWSEINKHHNYTPCREREIWWRHRYVYLPLCPLDNNYQPI